MQIRTILAAACVALLPSFALAAGDPPVPRRDTDPNEMPYGLWPTLTAGTNYAGQIRGIAWNCTGSGTTTFTDNAGNQMLWQVSGSGQQPFTPATFTAVSGCVFYGLKS